MLSYGQDMNCTDWRYYYCDTEGFVLLHSFRKKTPKTPRREIEKAKSERNDYLARKELAKS